MFLSIEKLFAFVALFFVISKSGADTPANCTFDDIIGKWIFYEGERGHSPSIDCSNPENLQNELQLELMFPNVVTDTYGNEGTWTLIYNQGFEVTINSRKYFAFSNWTTLEHHKVISRCYETKPGWSHDIYVRDWSCYVGKKQGTFKSKMHKDYFRAANENVGGYLGSKTFATNHRMISKINALQESWTASAYEQFERKSHLDIIRMMGGPKSRIIQRPKSSPVTRAHLKLVKDLPDQFDWRNVSNQNYVSPIRNQGSCGSCYAFASMAMLEARYRMMTKNVEQPVFSPQDVVECSEYSQGCDGGFPFLIAGKYGMDYGVVAETCNPYKSKQPDPEVCSTKSNCRRFYATNYQYVGGFYGASNEPLMRLALVNGGPLAVGFEVYDDFMNYASGIYHHTGLKDSVNKLNKWDPFQLTNHAVLVVGYGIDKTTNEPYWTVKNSWGPSWGENGFFRIRRGNDECGIESLAVEATPIPTY